MFNTNMVKLLILRLFSFITRNIIGLINSHYDRKSLDVDPFGVLGRKPKDDPSWRGKMTTKSNVKRIVIYTSLDQPRIVLRLVFSVSRKQILC